VLTFLYFFSFIRLIA